MKVARVRAGDAVFGADKLVLISGPCVIESEDSALRHAERIADAARRADFPYVFKSSFDKANRISAKSFRGPGLERGLEILARVKREIGVAILTDIHEPEQAKSAAEVADILQIPALLSRQTDLIVAAAKTGQVVNIKKGQFLSPWDMRFAIEKATEAGSERVILTERGFSFGYNNLVTDPRALAIMRSFGYPVVFDATHSAQLPGAGGGKSGGQREFVAPLARAATAVGIDGIFMEVHEDPDHALSDGPNSFRLADLPALLDNLRRIHECTAAARS